MRAFFVPAPLSAVFAFVQIEISESCTNRLNQLKPVGAQFLVQEGLGLPQSIVICRINKASRKVNIFNLNAPFLVAFRSKRNFVKSSDISAPAGHENSSNLAKYFLPIDPQ